MKTNPTMQAEAVLPTRPVSENGKINILTRLAYGGGDVACNVVYGMIATLLTLFYTDYAGVSVATVGLVMLISRFFDGGSDVVMGFIVDRTHSKWGQSRPWILWMSLPYALSAILLFSVPHTNATIQFLYIFVTYNFCTTVCYTAINLPYGSLSAMMTRDSKERDLLSVFRMGLAPMGRIIAVTCTMPLIKLFGNDQAAWVKVMSIWAAIAFLLLITCFVKCEETVHITARSEEKIPVGRSLKALVTNQYFWAVLLLWMFQSTNQAVVGTILPYYCKYVFHNDSWMYSTLYLSETIVLIVFTFLCPLLRDMLGKRNMIVAGAVLVLISQGLFFLNTTSFSWCLFTTMLRGVGEAPLCAFVFGMIGDVVEFGQWKHHIRQESFIFAGGSVGTKLGTGIAQASIAGIMSLCGYISSTGSAVVQSQSAINSIINIYMFGPLLIFVGVLIVGLLYQLDKKYPAIMKELAEREARGECNFLIFIILNRSRHGCKAVPGIVSRPAAPVGRAFSVCAPCPPCREADIHKKFIAAALRLSALLYIINAEHIPVSPLPITERFR
ncbi:MAG: MFS transporter [Butyricicoccus sp.]